MDQWMFWCQLVRESLVRVQHQTGGSSKICLYCHLPILCSVNQDPSCQANRGIKVTGNGTWFTTKGANIYLTVWSKQWVSTLTLRMFKYLMKGKRIQHRGIWLMTVKGKRWTQRSALPAGYWAHSLHCPAVAEALSSWSWH